MIPYIFYNYSIEKDDSVVDALGQINLINRKLGVEVAYRKKNPSIEDLNTCIITPNEYSVAYGDKSVKVLCIGIAKHVTSRGAMKWDRSNDKVNRIIRSTDEDVIGELLLLPEYGKLAAADRTGESYLSAASTVGRFRSVLQSEKNITVKYSYTSSAGEIKNAIKAWKLSEFSFAARPFNPSVHRQGQKLHEILSPNNAKIQGKITPNKGDKLEYADNGIIWEVVGLGAKGYAEYGAKGLTADGNSVQILKADPTSEKKPVIKMFLEGVTSAVATGKALVAGLLDIHGHDKA